MVILCNRVILDVFLEKEHVDMSTYIKAISRQMLVLKEAVNLEDCSRIFRLFSCFFLYAK